MVNPEHLEGGVAGPGGASWRRCGTGLEEERDGDDEA
jgi:hypothetical protein